MLRNVRDDAMPGLVSNAAFKRNAVWLCRGYSHQWATTNSGRITVKISSGCNSCTVYCFPSSSPDFLSSCLSKQAKRLWKEKYAWAFGPRSARHADRTKTIPISFGSSGAKIIFREMCNIVFPSILFWQKRTRVNASKPEMRTLGYSTLFRFRCADSFVMKLANLLKTVLKKRYVP